jgi:hypothetical protein
MLDLPYGTYILGPGTLNPSCAALILLCVAFDLLPGKGKPLVPAPLTNRSGDWRIYG